MAQAQRDPDRRVCRRQPLPRSPRVPGPPGLDLACRAASARSPMSQQAIGGGRPGRRGRTAARRAGTHRRIGPLRGHSGLGRTVPSATVSCAPIGIPIRSAFAGRPLRGIASPRMPAIVDVTVSALAKVPSPHRTRSRGGVTPPPQESRRTSLPHRAATKPKSTRCVPRTQAARPPAVLSTASLRNVTARSKAPMMTRGCADSGARRPGHRRRPPRWPCRRASTSGARPSGSA